MATSGISIPVGIIFGIAVGVASFFVTIPIFIFPIMMCVAPIMVLLADRFANRIRSQKSDQEITSEFNQALRYLNQYHRDRLAYMCPTIEDKKNWLNNSDRNGFGYATMPLLGLAGLITCIILFAMPYVLPGVLLGVSMSLVFPLITVGIAVIAITAALVYLHFYQDIQDDNSYRLDYKPASLPPSPPPNSPPTKNFPSPLSRQSYQNNTPLMPQVDTNTLVQNDLTRATLK